MLLFTVHSLKKKKTFKKPCVDKSDGKVDGTSVSYSRMYFLYRGNIKGTSSSKILCSVFVYMFVLFYICFDINFVDFKECGLITRAE